MRTSTLIFRRTLWLWPYLFSNLIHGQGFIPEFQTPIYFEDAVGNKDTVFIGYDTLFSDTPTFDIYHPTTDGVLINAPFDSVLDIRILHIGNQWDGDQYTSKKIVLSYGKFPNSECGVSDIACFAIQCKYPPLKMRYDSTQFATTTCRSDTWISADSDVFFVQYWWTETFTCLGYASEIIPDLTPILPNANVLGLGLQYLPGFYFVFKPWGACSDTTLLSDKQQNTTEAVTIFPNPVTNEVQIKIPNSAKGLSIVIFNALGQQVQQEIMEQQEHGLYAISTSNLSNGIYFLSIYGKGIPILRSFIVQK